MFGFAPFARTTFAGLGSNTYAVSLSESLVLTDAQTAVLNFTSAITETVALTDTQTNVMQMYPALTETVVLTDAQINEYIKTSTNGDDFESYICNWQKNIM